MTIHIHSFTLNLLLTAAIFAVLWTVIRPLAFMTMDGPGGDFLLGLSMILRFVAVLAAALLAIVLPLDLLGVLA